MLENGVDYGQRKMGSLLSSVDVVEALKVSDAKKGGQEFMSRYSMMIQWSDEDQLFLVTIAEFADLVVMPCTHGKNREEAIHNGEEVNQKLRCKQTEYETALFLSNTYAPRGGESTLEEIEMYLEAWQAESKPIPEPRTLQVA